MNVGGTGEAIAEKFLEKQGHEILERNFRFKYGEIDIISFIKGVVVFTEVKTRTNVSYGDPKDAVDMFKRRQIYMTAEHYLAHRSPFYRAARFDVIEVFLTEKPMIHYIKNAFDGNDLGE
ncbi:YraN family protein [Peptoniphilus sp. EMRHCC_23]|uniref:YraN family protein n=1 Tax=Peptoniphilus rachelemmaiella TaxID=2811779 RepID=UPI001C0055D9|nr:YraN family protein [Peptoniphilus rachelemmaiella]